LAGLALTPGVRWLGGLATVAFVATNTAAAAATLTWLILESVLRGKPTAVGPREQLPVGVTPAAGFVTPLGAFNW